MEGVRFEEYIHETLKFPFNTGLGMRVPWMIDRLLCL